MSRRIERVNSVIRQELSDLDLEIGFVEGILKRDPDFVEALRILGDPAAASDAAQEAFISGYKNLRGYRGGSFRAWMLRIVANACFTNSSRKSPSGVWFAKSRMAVRAEANSCLAFTKTGSHSNASAFNLSLKPVWKNCSTN